MFARKKDLEAVKKDLEKVKEKTTALTKISKTDGRTIAYNVSSLEKCGDALRNLMQMLSSLDQRVRVLENMHSAPPPPDSDENLN